MVMARSPDLLGPYEVHPDGAVLTSAGRRDVPIARAGHGDLVELADGSTWLAYLCGRPLPGRERCIMGRETEIGRASCRERVCQFRVDLGGRRILKKKNTATYQ